MSLSRQVCDKDEYIYNVDCIKLRCQYINVRASSTRLLQSPIHAWYMAVSYNV